MENLKEKVSVSQKDIQLFTGCSIQESIAEYKAICQMFEKEKITMDDCLCYWRITLDKKVELIKNHQGNLNLLRNKLKGSVFISPEEIELVFKGDQDFLQRAYSEACKILDKKQISLLDWCTFIKLDLKHLGKLIEHLNEVRNNH